MAWVVVLVGRAGSRARPGMRHKNHNHSHSQHGIWCWLWLWFLFVGHAGSRARSGTPPTEQCCIAWVSGACKFFFCAGLAACRRAARALHKLTRAFVFLMVFFERLASISIHLMKHISLPFLSFTANPSGARRPSSGLWTLGLGAGGLGLEACFLAFGAWIRLWVGAWRLGDWGLGVCAMHYASCAICYILCNMGMVCVSFVLSSFCYVPCVVCCVLCAMHCATCADFTCLKYISGNGALRYVIWAICYILRNIRIVNISFVLNHILLCAMCCVLCSMCYTLCKLYVFLLF